MASKETFCAVIFQVITIKFDKDKVHMEVFDTDSEFCPFQISESLKKFNNFFLITLKKRVCLQEKWQSNFLMILKLGRYMYILSGKALNKFDHEHHTLSDMHMMAPYRIWWLYGSTIAQ